METMRLFIAIETPEELKKIIEEKKKLFKDKMKFVEKENLHITIAFLKKEEKGIHKGRVISPKGISLFDKVASRISGKKPEKKQDERKAKPEKTNTGKTQEDKINRKIKDEGNDSKKVKDNPESNQIAEKQKQK